MKNFYATLKAVYGPTTTSSSPPLLSADGNTLISDKEKILERWAVAKAIKRLSSGKVPGADSIPAEVYAAGGPKAD